jgi:hypothetical protein
MLNNSGAPGVNRTEVGRSRDRWFRRAIEASPDVPKIVCCHIPLAPLRMESVLAKSFGFASYVACDDELLKVIDAHSDRILAVLSGHLHLSGAVKRKGVYHVVTSGTASYPCDFASYEVFADHIRVRMHSLPRELVTPMTDIHGKPRYKIDYTDAEHPTHQLYVAGNASERAFDIPLRQDK